MRILGIDPGSRKTGYAVVEHQENKSRYIESGCIRLGEKTPLSERLLLLSESLGEIIERLQPECGVVEQIFMAKNAKSALVLGHARGVILLKIATAKMPLYEYAPLKIKQSLVGVGSATKDQVQHMVRILLSLQQHKLQEDESDALAVALTHSHLIPALRRGLLS